MTILEAAKTGFRFRRPGMQWWIGIHPQTGAWLGCRALGYEAPLTTRSAAT